MTEPGRCSRCILPDTFPDVRFDESGVCSLCSSHQACTALGEARLRKLVGNRRGSTYDCVVTVSGGKDSVYVLHYVVTKLNLRPLAVMYDSGFQADLAKENAARACEALGVPLVVKAANWRTQRRMLEELLRISQIGGTFFNTCMNCEANIRAIAINAAAEHRVPFLFHGTAAVEKVGTPPFMRRRSFLRRIPSRSRPRLFYHAARYCLHSIRQRMEMKLPLRLRFLPKGIPHFPDGETQTIHFYDYIEWEPAEAVALLKDTLGWRCPPDREHRFDCLLHCLANHHWLRELGITWDGFIYAAMVREELITREQALAREQATQHSLEKECARTIATVGMKGYRMPTLCGSPACASS